MTIQRPGLTFQASLEWELDQVIRKARSHPDYATVLFERFLKGLAAEYPDVHADVDAEKRILTLHCRKWTTTRRF